jgi:hypothetical protein
MAALLEPEMESAVGWRLPTARWPLRLAWPSRPAFAEAPVGKPKPFSQKSLNPTHKCLHKRHKKLLLRFGFLKAQAFSKIL